MARLRPRLSPAAAGVGTAIHASSEEVESWARSCTAAVRLAVRGARLRLTSRVVAAAVEATAVAAEARGEEAAAAAEATAAAEAAAEEATTAAEAAAEEAIEAEVIEATALGAAGGGA